MLLLQRHDCAAHNFELGTATCAGYLSVFEQACPPAWLMEYVYPPLAPASSGTLLRLSARAARADFDAPASDSASFARAVGSVFCSTNF